MHGDLPLWFTRSRLRVLAKVLLIVVAVSGCLRTPQKPDENFPTDWPAQFSSLGPRCQELDGSYMNKGMVASKSEPPREILLSDLLLRFDRESKEKLAQARVVSLHADVGFAFATLYITGGEKQIEVPRTCTCYKGTLLVGAVDASSWGFPYVGIGGSQTNAWLTKANDGSLIVLIEGNTSGFALLVPYYYQGSTGWARFTQVTGPTLRQDHLP